MADKISKRARAEAIEACLCRADQWIANSLEDHRTIGKVSGAAHGAIVRAEHESAYVEGNNDVVWLEAAAILRGDDDHEPWNPGDTVYIRSKQGA